MENTIETFDKFSRIKSQNRKQTMRKFGFEYKGDYLIESPVTPRSQADSIAESFNACNGSACHVVYWPGARNMDGWRGYQYWIKEL